MADNVTTYSGFAGPVPPLWKPVNGSRGRRRKQSTPIDYGVVHLWVSPEDGPDRYLKQLATPALPTSGRTFQSSDGRGGWSWESPSGARITDSSKAKPYTGRSTIVYRSGAPALVLKTGDPMPWCYGPGYHCVMGVDGEFHFAVNPDDIAANHAPPFNDRAVGAVLPGRYQTDEQWRDATSLAELEALAKLFVYAQRRWGIPMRHVDAAALRRGEKGWAGHVDVNLAFRQGNHGDPGHNFPWAYVVARAHAIQNGGGMARIVNVYDDKTWQLSSTEAFAMSGCTLEWVQTPAQLAALVQAGAAQLDPRNSLPYGIWRSALKNFRRMGAPHPSTVFADAEFLAVDQ